MRTPPSGRPAALVALLRALLWTGASAALAGCSGEEAPKTNLLIVSFDTLRADRLGAYGNHDWDSPVSPCADALAARGTLFEDCLATRGQTHPSLGSLLTGKYPITTGLRENSLTLLPEHKTLFQLLNKAGWVTGVFVANFDEQSRFDDWVFRGADSKGDGYAGRREQEARNESRFQQIWDDRVEQDALAFLDARGGGQGNAGGAPGALSARADKPFAAWVHFYNIHKPFNPPAEFQRYGLEPDVPEVLRAPGPDSGQALEEYLAGITLTDRPVAASELRRVLGLYDGGVSATDARLGRLLDKLDERGLTDSTLVLFTADHGDELFEHERYFFHGNSVYRGTLHIPLILAGAGLPAGVRLPTLVQNVDVAPTVLDLLGVPVPADMEGRSLAALLRGTSTQPPRPFAYIEWQDVLYAVSDGKRSYVHNPNHALLFKEPFSKGATRGFSIDCVEGYELDSDPHEQHNLLAGLDANTTDDPALPPEFAAMRKALLKWLAEPQHEREMSWPGLSQEGLERMRQLGYAGSGPGGPDFELRGACR